MEYICTSNFLLNGIRVECGFRNAWHIIHACEILSDEGRPVLISWQAPHKAAEVDWTKYSIGIPEGVADANADYIPTDYVSATKV